MSEDLLAGLVRSRLLAILRLEDHADALDVAACLVEAGVTYLELTVERPGGFDALAGVVDALGSRCVVGAGTVTNVAAARRALELGARFVVAPDTNEAVISEVNARGALCLPGAFTPSEVARAVAAGAGAVKLFPASTGGVAHLRALRGPFPDVPFVPTGGVSAQNAAAWLEAGAVAVALGSSLVPLRRPLEGLAERARAALAAVGEAVR